MYIYYLEGKLCINHNQITRGGQTHEVMSVDP